MAENDDVLMLKLEFPKSAIERLHELKIKTESKDFGQVILNALRLYDDVVNQAEAGNKFLLEKPDGKTEPYPIFG